MKKIVSLLLFLGVSTTLIYSQASICAVVDFKGAALENAKIYVKSDKGIESFYVTDSLGLAVINGLDPGSYNLFISDDSKSISATFTEIKLSAGSFYIDRFSLSNKTENIFVKKDEDWVYSPPAKDDVYYEDSVGAVPASAVRGSRRDEAVSYYADEMPAESAEMVIGMESADMGSAKRSVPEPIGGTGNQNQSAGQLTASEWSDLTNWDLWSDQVNEEFLEFAEVWNLKPQFRTSIQLKNRSDQALVHALVQLIGDGGKVLAAGRTNNKGTAELFSDVAVEGKVKLLIDYMGASFTLNNVKSDSSMDIKLRTACNNSNAVEIMFVVDATGSMGDEINYLKAEVQDVIQRIADLDKNKEVRSGAIFYRDHTDAYLSRRKELSTDVASLNTFIQDQAAGGGGDFPEALDYALDELTNSINWSSEAITKLAFLILDAPPHEDSASVQRITASVKRAAEMGIRLIPVTGSGINKSTEYLMKALAISTNGTYLYLTDDSGIGGKHLEASNDKSDVEFLNDLMVRIVKEMMEVDCFEANTNADDIVNDWGDNIGFSIFPNPAADYLNMELDEDVDGVRIIDLQGQTVKEFGSLGQGFHQFDLVNIKSGTYFVVVNKGTESYALKLVCTN